MTYAQAQHELAALTADYYAGNMTYAAYTTRYAAIAAMAQR